MSETFDSVTANPGSGGANLCGDAFTQSSASMFLPACYLVFGPQDGPYTRVDLGSGLPIIVQNSAVPVSQSGIWSVGLTGSLPTGSNTLGKVDQGTGGASAWKVDGSAVTQPVSGSVSATQAGPWNIATVTTVTAVSAVTSITNVVHMDDNGGSLTVDAPVGTPVFVRLSDGSAAISTLPVSLASVPSHAVTNVGTFAVQATVAANATNIAKAEDVASADADVGVPAMAVRKATPANTSGTDGDYEMLQISAGRLWCSTTIDTALPSGSNVIGHVIVDSGTVTTVSTVTSLSQWAGNAIDTNSGSKSAGTLRIVLATDQPQLTNKLLVTPDSVALPIHQSVNLDQWNGVAPTAAAALADGTSNPTTPLVGACNELFNEATWDRRRGNTGGTALVSAARTANIVSASLTNYNARGVICYLNVTAAPAAPGAGGIQLQIYGVDTVSGNAPAITAVPVKVTAVGSYAYMLYPGVGAAVGAIVQATSGVLPRSWVVGVTHNDAQSYTYSVSYGLIL